jgi:hypothetical protein
MELLDEARLRVPRFLPLEYHRLAEEVARTPSDAPSALRGYVTAGVQAPEEFEFVTDRQSLRRTIHPWVEEAR